MGLYVLSRRSLLSAYINDTVSKSPSAKILSVAPGHCRELAGTLALADDVSGEIIGFGQDSDRCAEAVRSNQGRFKTVVESVKKLMFGQVADLGKFDLFYSVGLYDYLPDPLALRLSEALKALLTPKGRLVIGYFSRGSHGRANLDFLMDWHLIYRTEIELIRLPATSQHTKFAPLSTRITMSSKWIYRKNEFYSYWTALYRRHYSFSDQPGDVHSPKISANSTESTWNAFWYGHVA
jgi:SAM-dependent methyltransferase